MTAATTRRVEKVAAKPSVQAMVLAELREAHEHESTIAYAKSLLDYKGPTLCDRVTAAVQDEMKGAAAQTVRRVVRQRCHEALFLVHLAQECDGNIQRSRRPDALMILALLHEFRLFRFQIMSDEHLDPKKRIPTVLKWREMCLDFVADREGMRRAIRALEEEYFAGHSVLFPETVELLDTVVREAEKLAGWFEDLCMESEYRFGKNVAEVLRPIQEIDARARTVSAGHVRELLDIGRAEALEAMGMKNAVVEVYRRYRRRDDAET